MNLNLSILKNVQCSIWNICIFLTSYQINNYDYKTWRKIRPHKTSISDFKKNIYKKQTKNLSFLDIFFENLKCFIFSLLICNLKLMISTCLDELMLYQRITHKYSNLNDWLNTINQSIVYQSINIYMCLLIPSHLKLNVKFNFPSSYPFKVQPCCGQMLTKSFKA